jgi:hypothetical protein
VGAEHRLRFSSSKSSQGLKSPFGDRSSPLGGSQRACKAEASSHSSRSLPLGNTRRPPSLRPVSYAGVHEHEIQDSDHGGCRCEPRLGARANDGWIAGRVTERTSAEYWNARIEPRGDHSARRAGRHRSAHQHPAPAKCWAKFTRPIDLHQSSRNAAADPTKSTGPRRHNRPRPNAARPINFTTRHRAEC